MPLAQSIAASVEAFLQAGVKFAAVLMRAGTSRRISTRQSWRLLIAEPRGRFATQVTYVLPSTMVRLQYYVDANNRSPFAEWFEELNADAVARVTVALVRLGEGKLGNTKSVGSGVFEYRIDFGSGYRVYFGRDGDMLIILLAGGTKRRQQRDINAAKQRWQEYKARKRGK